MHGQVSGKGSAKNGLNAQSYSWSSSDHIAETTDHD
jgi:hypothetical protein